MRELWITYKESPLFVRISALLMGMVLMGCIGLLIVVPAVILLLAFPKLWILIGVFTVLLVIGLIKGKRIEAEIEESPGQINY
jgi:hypothetical protein